MRAGLLLTVCMFALVACSSNDDVLNETQNSFILRSESIDVSSMHLAFPSIVGNRDRSKIIVTYREGKDHVSYDGKIIQMESRDKGKTWINRKVIYRPAVGSDARDPQLLLLPDNNVLCRFFEREASSKLTVKSITSYDCGESYQNPVLFPFPDKEETFAAARGNMVVINKVIYAVCYNRLTAWLMKSEDEGKNWQFVSFIDKKLGTSNSLFGRINETSLGYVNGKLYLVGRSQTDQGKLQIAVSEDLGITWKWDWLPMTGHAPSLTPHKGSFILTYRQVDKTSGTYSFVIALLRDGKLVSKPVALFEGDSFDLGYGDVLTLSNSFLVCCYQPKFTIHYFEIKYDIFK
ncbi:MAG: sialidase family protein [Tannerellaceae bacterium]